ncbi:sigma-70 family RNA polymerase sigma factor [Verrucomicrobiaceae bacterium R5-34]|uniref:RNA polymerase sigma factor n=1 Tax=Oceaniferula flava TaxID=2800421 RepID=A0AAE2SDY8_9BACT|nr:sigma-70 family RNA polymerase sigma factor [Oceaniferula flavus]MBK1830179.1 sigma-70 family RNA polymerase sigma factor [Verrucomicrobiaceae bacterium R5-34]MBK1854770.1 sigma-70 family RNA polymerase sigma factor [Oceaniferula flavus]MBM1136076.1 sigma-70 family RNA polymerase sigma factor [Oceaniferula flavus]
MTEPLQIVPSPTDDPLSDLSDEELVKVCQQQLPHELEAYRVLVQRHEAMVYNLCMKFLGSPEDAEEVAQDSLLQVFHKIHQFEGRSAFKTWLYKIVHNYCRNRISKIIRKREVQEAYEEHAKEDLPSGNFENAQTTDKTARIHEALNKLKPKEKEILVYKFISGMTLQEISDVTDIGVSAAKMRYYRALESFKEAFERTGKPLTPVPNPVPTES